MVPTPPVLVDLRSVATVNYPTVATNMAESTSFLYSGPNPVQIGVAQGLIEPVRLAIVRGRVLIVVGSRWAACASAPSTIPSTATP